VVKIDGKHSRRMGRTRSSTDGSRFQARPRAGKWFAAVPDEGAENAQQRRFDAGGG